MTTYSLPRTPPTDIEHPYIRISFKGKARAFDKYLKLQSICDDALSWMAEGNANKYEAAEISWWMLGSGGFVRPHMPYYVTLTPQEWKLLVHAVRRNGTEDTEYAWMRAYARWI